MADEGRTDELGDRFVLDLTRVGNHRAKPDQEVVDRNQAGLDRQQAVLDREQARLDRAQATLDREDDERQDYLLDDLTGTLRRGPGFRELEHEIDRARREGNPLVVAFVDIDGLKEVNDRGGHAAGDQLLRDVADALSGDFVPMTSCFATAAMSSCAQCRMPKSIRPSSACATWPVLSEQPPVVVPSLGGSRNWSRTTRRKSW
jgi:hypothetical protein